MTIKYYKKITTKKIMENKYLSRQTKMVFPGEAYQPNLFSNVIYSELTYVKPEAKTKEKELPNLFKDSQLELKLK